MELAGSGERPSVPYVAKLIAILGISMSIYQFYISLSTQLELIQQRAIHLGFGLVLTFLIFPTSKKLKGTLVEAVFKVILIFVSISTTAYIVQQSHSLVERFGFPNSLDVLFGLMLVLVSLEATRRVAGKGLPIIALVGIVYVFTGPYLPGLLQHSSVKLSRFISYMYLTTQGIYGSIIGISATFVFMFILFGAFLNKSGAGEFYIKFALALLGKVKGGPAYVAVLSSALMGMISGSGVANAATVGVFTIPLMKRVGFAPSYAAAIEALSSTGGQLMPPVMGAAAFIMVDFLGKPYSEIVKAAFIPAFLYFISIGFMIFFQMNKLDLNAMDESELPKLGPLLKANYRHFFPPVVLIILLSILKYTPLMSAIITIVFIVVQSWFAKENRLGLKEILAAFEDGSRGALSIVSVCAVAGIVVGIIDTTGLGLKVSSILIAAAGGSVFILLVLTMLASFILGMGLPTTASYIILAVVVAPTLVQMHVPAIAAHLFVFYFGLIALITPPVAGCVYITAGIANSNPWKTGWTAVRLGAAGYLVPYMFIYNPALVAVGTPGEIILTALISLLAIFILAAAAQGYLLSPLGKVLRVALLVSALMIALFSVWSVPIGVTIFVAVTASQYFQKREGGVKVKQVETLNRNTES